jgi:hypothetical protein
MTSTLPYLQRYKQAFEAIKTDPQFYSLFQHQGNDLNFASPLDPYKTEYNADILFLGINPSFRKGARNEPLYNKSSDGKAEDYFRFEYYLTGHDLTQKAKKREAEAEDNTEADTYFKKIVNVAKDAGLSLDQCGYLDLFVYRCTDQANIKNILNANEHGIPFLIAQIEIFYDIITQLVKPKLIVVLNSQAQIFLGLHAKPARRGGALQNVWLGLQTSPTDIPMIHRIHGAQPQLSPDFNKRNFQHDFETPTYILPFKYLKYLSKVEIENLIATLQKFNTP